MQVLVVFNHIFHFGRQKVSIIEWKESWACKPNNWLLVKLYDIKHRNIVQAETRSVQKWDISWNLVADVEWSHFLESFADNNMKSQVIMNFNQHWQRAVGPGMQKGACAAALMVENSM